MNANVSQFPARDEQNSVAKTGVPVYQPKGSMHVGNTEEFKIDLANLKFTSAISQTSKFVGNIRSTEGYIVEGTLEGDLDAFTVLVRPHGSITGNVRCNILIVEGCIEGNIDTEKLVITATGKVDCNSVEFKDLITYKGHSLEGTLRKKR